MQSLRSISSNLDLSRFSLFFSCLVRSSSGIMSAVLDLQNVYDPVIVKDYSEIRCAYPAEWVEDIKLHCGGAAAMKEQSLLDIATGTGQVIHSVGNYFQNVIAVDKNTNMINETAHSFPNLTVMEGRGEDLELLLRTHATSSLPVDIITAGQCLHWIDTNPLFWKSISSILNSKTGKFISSFYGPEMRFMDYQEINEFTTEETKENFVKASEFMKSLWNTVGIALPNSQHFYSHFMNFPFPFDNISRKKYKWKRWLTWNQITQFIRTGAALRCYNDLHKDLTTAFDIEDFLNKLKVFFPENQLKENRILVEWDVTMIICSQINLHKHSSASSSGFAMTSLYNASSVPQELIIREVLKVMEPFLSATLMNHCSNVTTAEEKALSLCDYGCAGGKNSLFFIESLVKMFKETSNNDENRRNNMQVYFVDLPSNDFNALIETIHGSSLFHKRVSNDDDLLKLNYCLCPGSFYDSSTSLLPVSGSVEIGFSFSSLHWLSNLSFEASPMKRRSFENPVHVYYPCALKANKEDPFVKYLHDQSQRDFLSFLSARSKEMASRGMLVLSCLGYNAACDDVVSGGYRLCELMGEVLYQVKQSLTPRSVSVGADDDCGDFFPIFPRCCQDIEKLFQENQFVKESFELCYCKLHQLSDPFHNASTPFDGESRNLDDYLAFIRGWSEKMIQKMLIPRYEEGDKAVHSFYCQLRNKIELFPNQYIFENNHIIIGIRKL
jgi:SAM-dependent methyltransferase